MFGTTATALVESIIFVFLTSAYDVGDRLFIPDINQPTRYHNAKVIIVELVYANNAYRAHTFAAKLLYCDVHKLRL
jgi:hypothetical protein